MSLKTLREIELRDEILKTHDCHKCEGFSNCTDKLEDNILNKIKQEAIKWIKEDIENYRNANIGLPTGEQGMLIHNFIVRRRQFWKDRFNIEESDLK